MKRFLLGLALSGLAASVMADEVQVIDLTQTGCQFVEPEGGDKGFQTDHADDCKAINAESGERRLAQSTPLRLKAGKYRFRVTNQNVPYTLGFWLRGAGLQRLTLPSVSGGGIAHGGTLEYEITLEPGKYVYSCPLNPTPDYPLIVEG